MERGETTEERKEKSWHPDWWAAMEWDCFDYLDTYLMESARVGGMTVTVCFPLARLCRDGVWDWLGFLRLGEKDDAGPAAPDEWDDDEWDDDEEAVPWDA